MERINITERDEFTGSMRVIGWFDYDKAEKFDEDRDWDGSNHISVNTGSQEDHEQLLRTAQGRWVLHAYSNRQGTLAAFEFISDELAREWLICNNYDTDVERFFGELEEERGPGRPAIGATVNVRPGDDLLKMIDEYAGQHSISRAEAMRRLLTDAVTRDRISRQPGARV